MGEWIVLMLWVSVLAAVTMTLACLAAAVFLAVCIWVDERWIR